MLSWETVVLSCIWGEGEEREERDEREEGEKREEVMNDVVEIGGGLEVGLVGA